MKSTIRAAAPPSKPLLIYDGDCRFCTLWIRRWQCSTGELVDYLASQDPQVAERFPEIPRRDFDSSVQLIERDGAIYAGAEAVFKSLGHNPRYRWAADFYRDSPAFAGITEWTYSFVARHRTFFSFVTRLLWGQHLERPSYVLVRRAFLSCLGVIYFFAFVSLWSQVTGLYGSNGIIPVRDSMAALKQEFAYENIGFTRYFRFPTLCWLGSSDGFLKFLCAAGTILSLLVVIGIAPAPSLFLLWLIYLSLCSVGEPFLDFQWDLLLLETGFLAIFLAPLQWLPRHPLRESPPSRVVVWLLRWVLFKLMFQSGCVKLLSHDTRWRNGTALDFHFETQPLPTWIGWYAHQLPGWIHRSDVWMMFAIEVGIPFLIFFPRKPRQLACLAILALQFFILLTGNYCFFNLLTMVLCVLLLDDTAFQKCLPRKWCSARTAANVPSTADPSSPRNLEDTAPSAEQSKRGQVYLTRCLRIVSTLVLIPLVMAVLLTSSLQFLRLFEARVTLPQTVYRIYDFLVPYRSFNSYGLFAVMTPSRPEIIIEGSYDGDHWLPYEFKYKPGDLKRRPGFVEPLQPRLDWQMWFAALGNYQTNPWFVNFCVRLLQGSPQVLGLMEKNPFPKAPPKYLRAVVYNYYFTTIAGRRKTGDWWSRQPGIIYLPKVSLPADQGGPSGSPARN